MLEFGLERRDRVLAALLLVLFNHFSAAIYQLVDQHSYANISEMVPAPTVRPPSRMANLKPFSIATGVISSMVKATLSPGITISVPPGSSATPVTSVVRK